MSCVSCCCCCCFLCPGLRWKFSVCCLEKSMRLKLKVEKNNRKREVGKLKTDSKLMFDKISENYRKVLEGDHENVSFNLTSLRLDVDLQLRATDYQSIFPQLPLETTVDHEARAEKLKPLGDLNAEFIASVPVMSDALEALARRFTPEEEEEKNRLQDNLLASFLVLTERYTKLEMAIERYVYQNKL